MPVTLASGGAAACVMASVSGDLLEAPGAALAGSLQNATAAFASIVRAKVDRAPMIVFTERHASGVPVCKGSLSVTVDNGAHWIAYTSRLGVDGTSWSVLT